MKQSLYIGKEPNLQRIIITSAVIHILFIALVAVPIKTRQREYKSYLVNIVTPTELNKASQSGSETEAKVTTKKPVKMKAPPRKRVPPKEGVRLEPEEKISKEIERLRAIRELARKKRKKEIEIARARKADEAINDAIAALKSRASSEGGPRVQGIPSTTTTADSESYYAVVTKKIWSEWIPPDYSATDLEVIISIQIDKEGKIVIKEIEKSSGNLLFDSSATKAITKASPLPPPPIDMEIGVRFYL